MIDTRESDLLKYIQKNMEFSEQGGKKVIGRLEKEDKVLHAIHNRLKTPGVYISVKEHISQELLREMIRALPEMQKANAANFTALSQFITESERLKSESEGGLKMLEELKRIMQEKKQRAELARARKYRPAQSLSNYGFFWIRLQDQQLTLAPATEQMNDEHIEDEDYGECCP
jgi:hypothetical protein